MNLSRLRIWAMTAALVALIGLVLAYPDIMSAVGRHDPKDGRLLPAFAGNRAEYGFALFSLFTMNSLAIRKLFVIGMQLRVRNWREEPDVGLYRIAFASLMLVIILGAAPDVGIMLLWGEVDWSTIQVARTIDRLGDGLTIVPFLIGLALFIRAGQLEIVPIDAVARVFNEPGVTVSRRALYLVVPRREALADYLRIVASASVIALGLALYK